MARRKKISGVYKITSPNNRLYIGSSNDIETRFSFYKNGLTNKQWVLKRSFEKYGIQNHKFEILEECNPEIRLKRESFYGNLYKSLIDFGGLNLMLPKCDDVPYSYSKIIRLKIAKSKIGTKASDNTKKKQSETRIKYLQNNTHPCSRLVLNLETGIFYSTIKEAALSINMKRTTLNCRLTGQIKNNTSFIYV